MIPPPWRDYNPGLKQEQNVQRPSGRDAGPDEGAGGVGRVRGIPETKQGPAGKNSVFSPEGIRSQCGRLAA